MTATTGKHISAARQATRHMEQFYTPAFSRTGSNPRLTHEAMILPAVRDAMQALEQALAAPRTRQQTKCNAIGEYLHRRGIIIALAEQTGTVIHDMPVISHTSEGIAEYQEAKRQANARTEAARLKAQRKQQTADKKAFTAWLTTGAGQCPTSYRYNRTTGDYITITGHRTDGADNVLKIGTVITSQGAESPLDHVRRALEFYDSRRLTGATWTPYHTNGHTVRLGAFTLDSIDEYGNVCAGCHTFTAQEITRFRKQHATILQEATEL
jgi:hypothetical protein